MQAYPTTHDYKPTHRPVRVEIVQAEEEAAWCWKALDDLIEERDPNLTHYETEWWVKYKQLLDAANVAAEKVTDLRLAALNECTCDPDPRRESTLCPVCRAANTEREMPY